MRLHLLVVRYCPEFAIAAIALYGACGVQVNDRVGVKAQGLESRSCGDGLPEQGAPDPGQTEVAQVL